MKYSTKNHFNNSIMSQNVGVNTEHHNKPPEILPQRVQHKQTVSLKLKERNTKHTTITGIKELNQLYIYGEMLGKGVFGTVVEITDRATKKVWALKIVDKKNLRGVRMNLIENEIKILRMVNHPHIIYLERTFESSKNIYLVIERCTTELANLLREKTAFTEPEARIVMDHLQNAISYLHKYEIVHRDLKLENILTAPNPADPSDKLYIKVSDFGLGIIKSGSRPDQMLSDRCGTLAYMAPEIVARSSYSQQCDVWAMGVICFLLLTGTYPFYSKNETKLSELICNQEPYYSGFTVSPEAINLLTKMLAKNPALRISAVEIGRHPWIRNEPMQHDSPENVLDMMQLWRSEMMVQTTSDQCSDWAKAFSTLERTEESSCSTANPQAEIDKKVRRKSSVHPTTKKVPAQSLSTRTSASTGTSRCSHGTTKKMSNKTPADANQNQNTISIAAVADKKAVRNDSRALSIKGKNTKLIRIGKGKDPTEPAQAPETSGASAANIKRFVSRQ